MYLGNAGASTVNIHVQLQGQPPDTRPAMYMYPPEAEVKRYALMCSPDNEPTSDISPHGVAIFVGQVPSMIPIQYLAWVIDTICAEYVVVYCQQGRKHGTARAWIRPDKVELVLSKTRVALLDVRGVWVPLDAAQKALLESYVERVRTGEVPEVLSDGRVPKSAMVFERLGKPKQNSQAEPEVGYLGSKVRR